MGLFHLLDQVHGNDILSIIWVTLFVLNFVVAPMSLGLFQLVQSFNLGFQKGIKYFKWHFGIASTYLIFLAVEAFSPNEYSIQTNLGEPIAVALALGVPVILVLTFCYQIFFHNKKSN
jgi:hypothetical protein